MRDFNDLDVSEKYRELVRVKEVMERYGRESGWMRWDGDMMRFYDSEVEEGVFVRVGWVRLWVAGLR